MSLLTGLLLACGGGVFAVACNRRRIELVMPAAMMCNALVLYFCFLLGFPRLGAYAVFGVNLALLAAGLLRARRDWHGFLRRLLTPGFAAFCLWSLIAYIITRYRVFSSWDEFTHWGSVGVAILLLLRQRRFFGIGGDVRHQPAALFLSDAAADADDVEKLAQQYLVCGVDNDSAQRVYQ